MSQAAIEQILGKMLLDPEFRQLAETDVAQALAGFDLTADELEGFRKMDFKEFGLVATELDERVSKGVSMQ